ncbi:MAG: hypothetical protein Tsb0020_54250 [Haliangiales bacterium]
MNRLPSPGQRRWWRLGAALAGMTCALTVGVGSLARARAQPSPAPTAGPELAARYRAQLERLTGHQVRVATDGSGFVIEDAAGEGKPLVGVVERRGASLWLVTADAAYRLLGPLAKPRIAGPGYRVWIHGQRGHHAGVPTLRARRLGVLAPPWARRDGPDHRAPTLPQPPTDEAHDAAQPPRSDGQRPTPQQAPDRDAK